MRAGRAVVAGLGGAPGGRPSPVGGILLPQFKLPSEAHGDRQHLRVLDLHVDAEWRQKAPSEELHPLGLVEMTNPGEQGLESVLIFGDHRRAATLHKLSQGGRSERRPVAEVEKLRESRHDRVPSSVWTWMYHICAPSSRL